MYGILRLEKLKSCGEVGGAASHHARTRPTPNSSEYGSDNPARGIEVLAGDGRDVPSRVQERIHDATGKGPRKNSVLAYDVFLGASPEYFRPDDPSRAGHYDPSRMEEFKRHAMNWLEKEFGSENVIYAVAHYDESTPHVQAIVTPITDDGRLSARDFTGGKQRLSQLQDRFADEVKPLGLQRGVKGSKARHEPLKRIYRILARAPESPLISIDPTSPPAPSFRDRANPAAYAQAHAESEVERALDKAERHAKRQSKRLQDRDHELQKREDERQRLRAETERLRDIPLESVLAAAGAERDRYDRKKYHHESGTYSIDPPKFYDHANDRGGGGAIDLAMALTGDDFNGARDWLASHFGGESVAAATARHEYERERAHWRRNPTPKPRPTTPQPKPSPHAEDWDRVRSYLIEQRRIPARIVENAIQNGTIFAHRHPSGAVNAAFRLGESGVELRGTAGSFHGTRGTASEPFQAPEPNSGETETVVVESAIDALSYRALHPDAQVLAWGGCRTRAAASWLRERAESLLQPIIAAFDADEAGNKAVRRLRDALGDVLSVQRRSPSTSTEGDWNDALRAAQTSQKLEAATLDDQESDYSRPG